VADEDGYIGFGIPFLSVVGSKSVLNSFASFVCFFEEDGWERAKDESSNTGLVVPG